MKTYTDFGIEIPTSRHSGNVKTICPRCHDQRHDKRDKSLSVSLDKGVWNCHYCGWKGTLHVGERALNPTRRQYRIPTPRPQRPISTKLAEWFKGRGISEATIKAMKINEGEQFMPQTGSKVNTVQFNYYLDGKLINVKYRTGDKHFMFEKDAELIPYNIDSITGKSECIITEGEIDCLSFIEIGHTNCISVPNGANSNLSYLDDFIDGWFEDKTTIYIAVDTDEKGLLLRKELVHRFGADRCKIVTYGEDCKDANEHLQKYGKGSLEKCLCEAKDIPMEGVYTVADFENSLDALFSQGMPEGVKINLAGFDDLCRFDTKRLAIVTGIPGSGKSEFIDEIVERLFIHHGWRTAYFSPENSPLELHASKLIEKLTGQKFSPTVLSPQEYIQAKNVLSENFFFINPKDDCRIESILERAKYLVRRYGIKALVIDPFNRLDLGCSIGKETDHIRDLLRKLTEFAQQNDILVFLVAHPIKLSRGKDGLVSAPNLYEIAGSAHFFNMADYGIVVHRDRPNNRTSVIIEKVRFKTFGNVGQTHVLYNAQNGRYIPYVKNQQPAWDNSNYLLQRVA